MAACFPPACIKAQFLGNRKNLASKWTGTSDCTRALKNKSDVKIELQSFWCGSAESGWRFGSLWILVTSVDEHESLPQTHAQQGVLHHQTGQAT